MQSFPKTTAKFLKTLNDKTYDFSDIASVVEQEEDHTNEEGIVKILIIR